VKLTTRIAIRQLRSRHSFGFISFSTILSILGLAIGISSLIIISCISRGFSDIVNYKLSGIDGHIRIRSYMSDRIHMSKIAKLDSSIYQISENVKATSPYIEKHAIVRNASFTEGIIVYGVPESALINIFQLNQFTSGTPRFNNKKSIIIGSKLSKTLNVKVGDIIMMVNVEKMAQEQILQAQNLTVVNIFQTDFPEYDLLLGFIPLQTANTFFEMNNAVSGLILNVDKPEYIELTELKLAEEVGLYPYMTTTWKERHSGLLEWLTIYDIPIKLIMIFITAVGIFNIAASLWMIIIEKTRDFGIMKSMGLSGDQIQKIIVNEGAFIGLAGSFGGVVLSSIIIYLQDTYHFIKLSNDIYFMDYLPVQPVIIYFIFYPLCTFFITVIFSYYPAYRASIISPAEALRYE